MAPFKPGVLEEAKGGTELGLAGRSKVKGTSNHHVADGPIQGFPARGMLEQVLHEQGGLRGVSSRDGLAVEETGKWKELVCNQGSLGELVEVFVSGGKLVVGHDSLAQPIPAVRGQTISSSQEKADNFGREFLW